MSTKPSSKFRVFLHQDTVHNSPVSASVTKNSSITVHSSDTVKQLSSVDSCDKALYSNVPRNGSSVIPSNSPNRRYGGAIVRVSDLEQAGGAPLVPAKAIPGERTRAPVVSWHDVGLTRSRKRQSSEMSDVTKSPKRTYAVPSTARRGKASVANKKTPKKRVGARTKRERGANVELALQSNGRPFDFSWSTVRGRRQLRYNGKTYRGGAAHALWAKIKKAGEASAPRVSPPRPLFSQFSSRPLVEAPTTHHPSSRATAVLARAAPLLDDEDLKDEVIVLSSSEEQDDKSEKASERDSLSWGSGTLDTPSASCSSEVNDEIQKSDMLYSAHPKPALRGNNQTTEGISVLGTAVAARPRQSKTIGAAASGGLEKDFMYAERYEDLNGLDCIVGEDIEGMFVVGDEIGGKRCLLLSYLQRMSPRSTQAASFHLLIRNLPSDVTSNQVRDVMRENCLSSPDVLSQITSITMLRGYAAASAPIFIPSTAIIELSAALDLRSQVKTAVLIGDIFDGKILFSGDIASSVERAPVPSTFPPSLKSKQRVRESPIEGTVEETAAYKRFFARPSENSDVGEDEFGKHNENKKKKDDTAVDGSEKILTALVSHLLAQDAKYRRSTRGKEAKTGKKKITILARGDSGSKREKEREKKNTTEKTRKDLGDKPSRRRIKKSVVDGNVEEVVQPRKKERRRQRSTREKKGEEKDESRKEGHSAAEKTKVKRERKSCGRRGANTGASGEDSGGTKPKYEEKRKKPQVRGIVRRVPTND